MAVKYDENSRGDWERSYNSFSGCDILATFGGQIVGEMQGITFTIQREKVPLYVFGVTDPIAYSRGKRGIAGSAVFLTFDRNALQSSMKERSQFWAKLREVRSRRLLLTGEDALSETLGTERQTFTGKDLPTGSIVANSWYADQIPPFNIVLTATNEYGGGAVMSIIGAEIVNDGSSVSIDDPVVDQSMTYVARTILPWEPLIFKDPALEEPIPTGGESQVLQSAIDQAVQEQQDLFSRGATNLVGI